MAAVRSAVLAQLDSWSSMFWPRVTGLTDEEYFWEPVPNCWSVRVDSAGRVRCDWEFPAPEPAPVTTIAWRLSHLAANVLAEPVARFVERGSGFDYGTFAWPGSAAAALAMVEGGVAKWRAGLATMSEAELDRTLGPEEDSYSGGRPFSVFAQWINVELVHHGAEVCLLRDLYRASGGGFR